MSPTTRSPFDLVVVPNAGMREWVSTELIVRLGVLSNVEVRRSPPSWRAARSVRPTRPTIRGAPNGSPGTCWR